MKFCKDCSRFKPDDTGDDGTCSAPVGYNLVTGKPKSYHASVSRMPFKSLCGPDGVLFEPKDPPKPEDSGNILEPSLSSTLIQKFKLLFK